jgi:Ca2+-binding RTX toxin-like protein
MSIDTTNEAEWIKDLTDFDEYTDQGIDGPFSWTGNSGQSITIKYSLQSADLFFVNSGIGGAPATASDITANATSGQIAAILAVISRVANITFTLDQDDPDLVFAQADLGSAEGKAVLDVNGQQVEKADIYIHEAYDDFSLGSEAAHFVIHEILHALGLSHPEDSESDPITNPSGEDPDFDNLLTAQSYNETSLNALASSAMIFDIAALQFLYGANTSTNEGTTTYTLNTNGVIGISDSTDSASSLTGNLVTVWDSGGTDTFQLNGSITDGARIDLRAGVATESDAFYTAGEVFSTQLDYLNAGDVVVINAFPSGGGNGQGLIEKAIGAGGDDLIFGNDLGNTLSGLAGIDDLYGNEGNDILLGYASSGSLQGDTLHGGNTSLDIDPAEDGYDTADYGSVTLSGGRGIKFDIADPSAGSARAWDSDEKEYVAGTTADILISIENVVGTGFDDVFVDTEGVVNTFDGGAGLDVIDYSDHSGSMTIDFNEFETDEEGNILNSIEGVVTNSGDDTFIDAYGVANFVDAGTGEDTLDYSEREEGLFVDLAEDEDGNQRDATAATINYTDDSEVPLGTPLYTIDFTAVENTFRGIEIIIGSDHNDWFHVDRHSPVTIDGGDGFDAVSFAMEDVNNTTDVGTIDLETLISSFGHVFENIEGFHHLPGVFAGPAAGPEESIYLNPNGNYEVLRSGILRIYDEEFELIEQTSAGGADIDNFTFWGFGTPGDDNMQGDRGGTDAQNDTQHGEGGDDTLNPGDGDDYADGGPGNDTFIAGHGGGNDTYIGGTGIDTIMYLSTTLGVTVDLSAGSDQGTGSEVDTDQISEIENVTGGSGDDSITGDSTANVLNGGDGNDTLKGKGGNDTLDGSTGIDTVDYTGASAMTVDLATGTATGDGSDTLTNIENVTGSSNADTISGNSGINVLSGAAGDDALAGAEGSDTLKGGAGNDTLNGGTDSDTADYSSAAAGIVVSLFTGGASDDGDSGVDTFSSIENVTGSASADAISGNGLTNILSGGAGADMLSGYDGDDTLSGGSGNDTLLGGGGTDTVDYSADGASVTVNLGSGTATDGGSGTDTLGGVENVIGSAYADTITGDGNANVIIAGAGNDTVDGAGGTDTIDYSTSAAAVTVNLVTGSATGDGTDSLTSIENVTGSAFADIITGSSASNVLNGGGGFDTVSFASAASGVTVNLVNGTATGDGTDTLAYIENVIGSSGNDNITGDSLDNIFSGGAGADTLVGSFGEDTLAGGAGNDTLTGGDGIDTADYSSAAAGVTVNLNSGTASNDGDGGSDTLSGIENAIGSAYNDTITGDSNASVLVGGAGADTLDGWHGNDTLFGGAGNDTLTGHNGTDTADYSADGAGVTVNLGTGSATDGGGGTDTLSGIENVTGSAFGDTLTGSTVANVLSCGAGNDTLKGGAGNDTLDGGDGTDTADYTGSGAVTVNLATGTATGDGTDTLSGIENVTGTSNADTITGDSSDNVLSGADGNDTLKGGVGDDTLTGGNGTDTVDYSDAAAGIVVDLDSGDADDDGDGGSDSLSSIENAVGSDYDDEIIGSSAANILTGGLGNDFLRSGAGNDTIYGNDGDDTIVGGEDNDTIDGGAGIDVIDYYESGTANGVAVNLGSGTASDDGFGDTDTLTGIENVEGTDYEDAITGDSGNNTIMGRAGDDTLDGSGGNDTVSYYEAGGAITVNLGTGTANDGDGYTDTLSNFENIIGSSNNDTITGNGGDNILSGEGGDDTISGGGGTDTVDYTRASSGVTVNLGTGTADDGDEGTDSLTSIENVIGSAYADSITGDGNANVISGGRGNDTLDGAGGTDSVDYSAAAAGVTVNLVAGSATGEGTDSLSSIEGAIGSAFADTLMGHSSANTLVGGAGNDTLKGGAGNDTLDGGADTDTADYSGDGAAVTVNLGSGTATDGSSGTDTLSNIENVVGSAYNDTLTGNGSANTLVGGAGNDTIDGDGGTDTLDYSAASSGVTVNLGTGSATGEGTDTLSNIESVTGSASADTLTGSSAANTLSGGGGNDTLAGAAGNDALIGGSGTDTANYSAAAAGVTVNLAAGTASNDGDGGSDTLSEIENVTGSGSGDTITGDAGDNVLDGSGGADTVDYNAAVSGVTVNLGTGSASGHGNDTLSNFENVTGSGFADTLTGSSAANVLLGGAGNDTLNGDDGADDLQGGADSDSYVFNIGDGSDSIDDASGSLDTIIFGAGIDPDDLTFTVNGNDLNVDYGNDDFDIIGQLNGAGTKQIERVQFNDGSILALASYASWAFGTTGADSPTLTSSADYYSGDAGNDTINGLAGADYLAGEEGNDTVNGGDGDDLITGGAGNDTLSGDNNNDTIYGGDGDDTISGGQNSDTLIGGLGKDRLEGLQHADTLYDLNTDVTVRLSGSLETGTWENVGYDTFEAGTDFNGNTVYQQVGDAAIYGSNGIDHIHTIFTLDGTPGYKAWITAGHDGDHLYLDSLSSDNPNYYWTFGYDATYGVNWTNVSDLTLHYTGTSTETVIRLYNHHTTPFPQYSVEYFHFTDTTIHFEDMPFFMKGTEGDETLFGTSEGNYIVALNGSNTVYGGDGSDFISGGNASDILYGEAGNDSILTFAGDDLVYAGSGNDYVEMYGTGNHVIYGEDGDDTFNIGTGSGNKRLYGGAGNDDLEGSSGADILDGGVGNDILAGGAGDDLYIYTTGLDEKRSDSGGTDTIFIEGGITINDITISNYDAGGNDDAKIVLNTGVDELIVHSLRHASSSNHIEILKFDDGFETNLLPSYNSWFLGTSGNNTVTGNGSDNVLIGYAGDDAINSGSGADDAHGGSGVDTIHGDGGEDLLHGGVGNDVLYGDDGLDTLYGGSGADTFMLEATEAFNNVDVIKDFNVANDNDVLDISDILDATAYNHGVDAITDWVEITTSGSDSVVKIDRDGTGGTYTMTQVATLQGITGLTDEAALVTSGNLLAA